MGSPGSSPGDNIHDDLEEQVYDALLDPAGDPTERIDALCAAHPTEATAIRAIADKLSHAQRLLPTTPNPGWQNDAATTAPDRLGEYELVREAGRGGMGVVFEAWQPTLRRSVALKILPSHLAFGPGTIERFRREGAAGARLKHEGIVDVLGFGADAGHHFLAMEFIEGAPLSSVLEADHIALDGDGFTQLVSQLSLRTTHPDASDAVIRAFRFIDDPIERMVRIADQVADALAHAHAAGIVHRDVKPSNIMLRADGRAVLTDFGLARDAELPALTHSGEFAGTPFYASPEQARGQRSDVDERSDVFSLGATLYEMITAARPFVGSSTHEILDSIQRREPREPKRCQPNVSADLSAVVMKALEKDPLRRYPTATAFPASSRSTSCA